MHETEDTAHPFIHHFELCFGKIERAWRVLEKDGLPKVNVVECCDGFVPNATVIGTVGLSNIPLKSSGKEIRHELFLMMKDGQFSPRMPAILGQIVEERVNSNKAVLRGEHIRKPGFLFEQGNFVALYATLPVYYPEELWSFYEEERGSIMLCLLLPIKQQELDYLHQNGWSKFEQLLDQAQFDMFDLDRPSLL